MSDCLRISGLGCFHCPKLQIHFSRINGLMPQCIEASNCSSCSSYHVKAAFCLSPPFILRLKVYGKFNMDKFRTQKSEQEASIHDSLSCPPDTILSLCCFLISVPPT